MIVNMERKASCRGHTHLCTMLSLCLTCDEKAVLHHKSGKVTRRTPQAGWHLRQQCTPTHGHTCSHTQQGQSDRHRRWCSVVHLSTRCARPSVRLTVAPRLPFCSRRPVYDPAAACGPMEPYRYSPGLESSDYAKKPFPNCQQLGV